MLPRRSLRSSSTRLLSLALVALFAGTALATPGGWSSAPKPPPPPSPPLPPEPPVAMLMETPEPPEPPEPPSLPHFAHRFHEWEGVSSRYIGVQLLELTPELRAHFGVDKDFGVLVARVAKDSPAEKAGLQVGDVLLRADGDEISSARDLRRALRGKDEGDKLEVEVSRGRTSSRLSVEVKERDVHGSLLGRAWDERRAAELEARLRAAEKRLQERLKETERRLRELDERLR